MRSGVCLLAAISWLSWISSLSAGGDLDAAADREVHAWTNRPIWPQAIDRPADHPPVPSSLHWDLWLGPVPERPYHPAYHPFKWRGWWDFGCFPNASLPAMPSPRPRSCALPATMPSGSRPARRENPRVRTLIIPPS
ncbi:MAG: hypothetical protein ABSH35_28215 [Isosphaeraceae bacterium]